MKIKLGFSFSGTDRPFEANSITLQMNSMYLEDSTFKHVLINHWKNLLGRSIVDYEILGIIESTRVQCYEKWNPYNMTART